VSGGAKSAADGNEVAYERQIGCSIVGPDAADMLSMCVNGDMSSSASSGRVVSGDGMAARLGPGWYRSSQLKQKPTAHPTHPSIRRQNFLCGLRCRGVCRLGR